MNDLVAWYREQLDKVERIAASGESWTAFDESQQGTRRVDVDHSVERVVACTRSWRGLHIARHDPAQALREIDAKRQNLAELEAAELAMDQASRDRDTARYNAMRAEWVVLRRVVRRDAAVYADRPGYREEWRP